ncbi:MAG: hypothetical protein LBJ72_03520 [Dysgonamonadaceae bacterium]|jgi:hypothetical protein|nr:hypothetical protein [Dysgonamonadaceae bacterium]
MGKKKTSSPTLDGKTLTQLQSLKDELSLAQGSIHLLNLTEDDGITLPDGVEDFHPKFVVILGSDEKDIVYGTVLIQSRPNHNIFSPVTIRKDFQPIKKKDYSFIRDKEHDPSYIDCGQIFSFTKERIIREKGYKCNLTNTDLSIMIEKLKNSDRIDPIDLIEYGIITT